MSSHRQERSTVNRRESLVVGRSVDEFVGADAEERRCCCRHRCSWLLRQLRAVPCCDDPHGRSLDSVEEPVGPNHDLAIGQIRKLRDDAAGFRKLLQPAQGVVGSLQERRRGLRVLPSDICDCREELSACDRREANPQEGSSPTSSPASASTSSRSCPTLAAISCSPRTRSRSSSRSRSPCS